MTRLEVVYNLGRMEQQMAAAGAKKPYTVTMRREVAEQICHVMGRSWARKVKIGPIWIKSLPRDPVTLDGTTLDNSLV